MKTVKTEATMTIKGVCNGEEFTEVVAVYLIPPKDDNHYGTGYYMRVEWPNGRYVYVDVRYEHTRDIEKLAKLWAKGYWGKNAREITVE